MYVVSGWMCTGSCRAVSTLPNHAKALSGPSHRQNSRGSRQTQRLPSFQASRWYEHWMMDMSSHRKLQLSSFVEICGLLAGFAWRGGGGHLRHHDRSPTSRLVGDVRPCNMQPGGVLSPGSQRRFCFQPSHPHPVPVPGGYPPPPLPLPPSRRDEPTHAHSWRITGVWSAAAS